MIQSFTLGSRVEHHHVLGGDELRERLVDKLCGNLLHDGARVFVFGRWLHVGLVVEEVVDKGIYELVVLPAVCLLHGGFVLREQLGLGPFDLIVGEAVALHLLDFGEHGLEASERVVLLAHGLAENHVACLRESSHAEACGDEWCVRSRADFSEALVHHGGYDAFEYVLHESQRRAVELFRGGLGLPVDLVADRSVFGVCENSDYGLFVAGNRDHVLRLGVLGRGDVGEGALYLCLHLVHVDVTHDDKCLKGRYHVW